MQVTFGKLKGKSVANVVLRHPDYIVWMLGKDTPSTQMAVVLREARRLIAIFDAKPFLANCFGSSCGKPAARFSVYRGGLLLYFWCGACKPYSAGAASDHLSIGHTYRNALNHVRSYNGGNREDYKHLIRRLAEAKGFPERYSEKRAGKFFA